MIIVSLQYNNTQHSQLEPMMSTSLPRNSTASRKSCACMIRPSNFSNPCALCFVSMKRTPIVYTRFYSIYLFIYATYRKGWHKRRWEVATCNHHVIKRLGNLRGTISLNDNGKEFGLFGISHTANCWVETNPRTNACLLHSPFDIVEKDFSGRIAWNSTPKVLFKACKTVSSR